MGYAADEGASEHSFSRLGLSFLFSPLPKNLARAAGHNNKSASCVNATDEERFCHASIPGTSNYKRILCFLHAFFIYENDSPDIDAGKFYFISQFCLSAAYR